ncbi:hypothetical protein PAXRUDRAFT_169020 [Paxillus rubicundulus Ve08.2h10]|uniref:Uncharacterized protein n=1 Tax=Paxillus rubicundulus Ve08.2h10 TaxID=930991 RepID=A0A0D0DFW4_9AGAM|nr:hypothetical protein PAXRUDRAFT_169020 [Paxillus rubicundulus Ve08.2h10]
MQILCREKWAHRSTTPVTIDQIVNPDHGDCLEHSKGWDEFRIFVDKNYRGLVRQETNPTGIVSSLGVFCRMDIGLMFDTDGRPSYFVNEVERTPTMSMWLNTVEDTTVRVMLDTFARVLHTHLTSLNHPYIY